MNLNPIYLVSFKENKKAIKFFKIAYEHQVTGNLFLAALNYYKSLKIFPTSEAYSFLGWVFFLGGKTKSAIKFSKKAIQTDPTLGNPYNDLGVYYLDQKKYSLSIKVLKEAKKINKYEYKFYPYFNLGRVYEITGHQELAREEYLQVLKIEPNYDFAKQALSRMMKSYN